MMIIKNNKLCSCIMKKKPLTYAYGNILDGSKFVHFCLLPEFVFLHFIPHWVTHNVDIKTCHTSVKMNTICMEIFTTRVVEFIKFKFISSASYTSFTFPIPFIFLKLNLQHKFQFRVVWKHQSYRCSQ